MTQERPYLPYGRQRLSHIGIVAVECVLRGDFLTTRPMVPVPVFESPLVSTVTARHAMVCSSGTSALCLATMTFDLEVGDAVLVRNNTLLAGAVAQ